MVSEASKHGPAAWRRTRTHTQAQVLCAGKPRGFAFVQFESAEAMHQACEALDGSELHKRQLSLRPQEAGHRATPAEAVPNCWFCLSNEQSDKRLVISVGETLKAWKMRPNTVLG